MISSVSPGARFFASMLSSTATDPARTSSCRPRCATRSTDPHLELIEEVPGSVWVRNEHSNLHHIGFWSDDLPHDSARLAGAGCPLQLCGRAGTRAPVSFAYHRSDLGVRVEVVDAAMREAMAFLFRRRRELRVRSAAGAGPRAW